MAHTPQLDLTWPGTILAAGSGLVALVDPHPLVVPIACALIAASVPLAQQACVFYATRSKKARAIAALDIRVAKLEAKLRDHGVDPDAN